MHQIGDIISQNRQNKHMTQEEFASRLGVTPQAVSRWERGNSLPDISLVEGICKVLGISANALLGIEGCDKVVENSDIVMEREIKNNLFAEPLVVEFGSGVIPCIVAGLETDYVNQCRKTLVKETGILLPVLRLRDNVELEELEVRILSYDKILWQCALEEICEDTYKELYKKIIDEVVELCKKNYDALLNKHLVKQLIEQLKEAYPGVADELVPERISYLQVERKLQEVLREKGNIRDLIHILEEMEENLTCS